MEPFEKDQLSQNELDALLREWKAPAAPAGLRASLFGAPRPWWQRFWTVSLRVPLPVACALALLAGVAVWRVSRPQPAPPAPPAQVVVRTERVEVPVDRVVTRYVSQPPPPSGLTFKELRPVSELRPVIIRSNDAKN